jgi:hypothetical protein
VWLDGDVGLIGAIRRRRGFAFVAGIAFNVVNLLLIGVLVPQHATPRTTMGCAADGEQPVNLWWA